MEPVCKYAGIVRHPFKNSYFLDDNTTFLICSVGGDIVEAKFKHVIYAEERTVAKVTFRIEEVVIDNTGMFNQGLLVVYTHFTDVHEEESRWLFVGKAKPQVQLLMEPKSLYDVRLDHFDILKKWLARIDHKRLFMGVEKKFFEFLLYFRIFRI